MRPPKGARPSGTSIASPCATTANATPIICKGTGRASRRRCEPMWRPRPYSTGRRGRLRLKNAHGFGGGEGGAAFFTRVHALAFDDHHRHGAGAGDGLVGGDGRSCAGAARRGGAGIAFACRCQQQGGRHDEAEDQFHVFQGVHRASSWVSDHYSIFSTAILCAGSSKPSWAGGPWRRGDARARGAGRGGQAGEFSGGGGKHVK